MRVPSIVQPRLVARSLGRRGPRPVALSNRFDLHLLDDPLAALALRLAVRLLATGNRSSVRLPGNSRNSRVPGTELAHGRGTEAKDGYCYRHSELQDADLHKTQHQIGGY
ncbi:polymorphic toxin type 8 domain-containing protein [Burkholderia gladioli]|uniref:polymorphic toxin type 8 domain-containing protein n=1 Tax=Burkholderia gladioli TaxID=28095 RepID=UPI001EE06444|nr:polymorphic toxin type 8 domain-containing protein [Burkholderia gladioli]